MAPVREKSDAPSHQEIEALRLLAKHPGLRERELLALSDSRRAQVFATWLEVLWLEAEDLWPKYFDSDFEPRTEIAALFTVPDWRARCCAEIFDSPPMFVRENASLRTSFVRAIFRFFSALDLSRPWVMDRVSDRIDACLDTLFGLSVIDVENRIQGRMQSYKGEAAWSEANPKDGWLTNYVDFSALLEELQLEAGACLVDIGSGHGRTGFVVGTVRPDLRYLGFEIVPARVEEAQRLARANGFAKAQFFAQDVSSPNFVLPAASVYYLYDALNEATAQVLLEAMAQHPSSRLVVREGKGVARRLLARDRRFRQTREIPAGERFYQSLYFYGFA